MRQVRFNSSKVQFERKGDGINDEAFKSFNSSKVQFEQLWLKGVVRMIVFQFQQGTIWTNYAVYPLRKADCFNSSKVQFERINIRFRPDSIVSFNSSKVQFEPSRGWWCDRACCVSIPARYNLNMNEIRDMLYKNSFNSSKVQFERPR